MLFFSRTQDLRFQTHQFRHKCIREHPKILTVTQHIRKPDITRVLPVNRRPQAYHLLCEFLIFRPTVCPSIPPCPRHNPPIFFGKPKSRIFTRQNKIRSEADLRPKAKRQPINTADHTERRQPKPMNHMPLIFKIFKYLRIRPAFAHLLIRAGAKNFLPARRNTVTLKTQGAHGLWV